MSPDFSGAVVDDGLDLSAAKGLSHEAVAAERRMGGKG